MSIPSTIKFISKKDTKSVFVILLLILLSLIVFIICLRFQTEDYISGIGVSSKLDRERKSSNSVSSDEDGYSSESINLALVCGGYGSTRSLYVLLKSILFYRTGPIHVHLFVDSIARQILEELLSSWQVHDLNVSFYNLTRYEKQVSWITNSHYSHRYGLMKLELASILADNKNLQKVIILDTDMLVLGDIKFAWREFANFPHEADQRSPIFGMVENQSGWYLDEPKFDRLMSKIRPTSWPAIGRGFNSGTILVDLEQLRSRIDWRNIWREEAETQLITHLSTTLADQDIFNAIFKTRGWLVHKLPCSLNLQLNERSELEKLCHTRSGTLQILHWNSPRKLDTMNPNAKLLKNWYLNFRNWDAKLLETPLSNIIPESHSSLLSELKAFREEIMPYCDKMRPKLSDKLRVFPFFMDFDIDIVDWDVTYVVHLSMDRIQVLDELAHNWQGPISASIYLPEQETDLLLSYVDASDNLSRRKNIGYHLVFRDHGFNYPINRMRNIALNHSITPYVFLCDIDFLPPTSLYEYLKQSISRIETEGTMRNKALVVPAFESKEYRFQFPNDKQELESKLNSGQVSEFRDQIWPEGHKQTDFEKWIVSTNVYRVEWDKDFEPFIVTRRDVQRFDERFIGFGWNKVEHITLLAALEYEFWVLPGAFVIHKIHPPSLDIMKHRESNFYKICIQDLKRTFLTELRVKYPRFMSVIYDSHKHDKYKNKSHFNLSNTMSEAKWITVG